MSSVRTYQRQVRKLRLAWQGASPGTKRKKHKELVMFNFEAMRKHFEAQR